MTDLALALALAISGKPVLVVGPAPAVTIKAASSPSCSCGKCTCGATPKIATEAEPFRGSSVPPIPLGAPVDERSWQREYWCGIDKHGDRYDGLNLDDLTTFLAARNRDEAVRWPSTIRSCNGQHRQPVVAAPVAAPVAEPQGRWVAIKVCRGGVCSMQRVWQPGP